jgi:PAS domain S-box-containing protein
VLENVEASVLEALLNTLPLEVSFINENDEVVYFNKNGDRIFPRSRGIIGRKVQQCHPQKSLHKVTEILEAFRSGNRDVAEFWITLKGRQIYIRYFPVKDNAGKYLGTLEVSQDITNIKNIEGEKRLLDWQ